MILGKEVKLDTSEKMAQWQRRSLPLGTRVAIEFLRSKEMKLPCLRGNSIVKESPRLANNSLHAYLISNPLTLEFVTSGSRL